MTAYRVGVPVLLHLNDARIARVGWRLDAGRPFTVALPEQTLVLPSRTWRLCLILADGPLVWDDTGERLVADSDPVQRSVVAAARIRGSGRYSTTDDRVKVADAIYIDAAVPVSELVRAIPREMRDESRIALQSNATNIQGVVADGILDGLLRLRPEIASAIQRLRMMETDATPVDGTPGEILALERDAVHLALSIAGIDPEPLTEWATTGTTQGFIPNLRYEAHEDVLLAYDASRFPNWTALPSNRPDWVLFGDGRNHIRIGSVNNTPLENTLGVDLIYRHIEADTFVLVQYKRMKRDANGRWFYRPDRQLGDQIEKMRKLSGQPIDTASPRTWRLHSNGFLLKLVRQPAHFDPRSDELLQGIYLPFEYLAELLVDDATKTDRGGRRLGYDNIDRYLTSVLFVSLVRQGWIGTRGLATQAVELLITAALEAERTVIIAEESSSEPGTARRRSGRQQ